LKRILLIGATSAIAEAVARLWAEQGNSLYLVGRDNERLQAMAADLQVRGAATAAWATLDVSCFERHASVLDAAAEALGGIDIALIAHGVLPDQKACERDVDVALHALTVNALSVISLAGQLANRLESQGSGTIAVIGSVAGDRGRQSNYVYGTGKAAVETFLHGLRNRLHRRGVAVLTIKPGFVDTPMTAATRKGALWATPTSVATGIVKAIERRADVVYLPGFWRLVMVAIRMVPETVFKRLGL
jgi:short-subunit dehydrogenase